MKEEAAQQVLAEAQQDQRLRAQLDTARVNQRGNDYRIKLLLRGLRETTISTVEEWKGLQEAWRDL